jgi:4-amino-4-deoxy-L-arabinose transferase-like glycosyltransferase
VIRRAGVLIPLLLALALSARTVNRESCTVDEFGNLPLTVVYWSPGGLHVDPGNPPLTRWIQGLFLLPEDPDPGVTRDELASIDSSWDLGYRFESAHPDDYHRLLTLARRGSVLMLLLTVLGVWRLTRDFAGPGAAFGAASVAAAFPDLLAHGRLVTPDVGLAALTVWTVWAAGRAFRSGRAAAAAGAGLLAGAAALAKFSALLLWPLLALALARAPGSVRQRLTRVAAFSLAALFLLYAGYGFPPPGTLAGAPTFLPAPVTAGLEAQLGEDPYPAYLLGEVKEGGWPWYYAVAMLVKVPLPTLFLIALGAIVAVRERRRGFLLPGAVAIAFFLAFGIGTEKNVGIRYVLPVLPLLTVVAAAAWTSGSAGVRRAATAGAALAVIAVAAASVAPIASFNGVERLFGGKRAVLADSNLDWGQALPDLRDWMEREGIETVQLAYFGRVNPDRYGIRWKSLPPDAVRGPVAISATLAVGRPYVVLAKRRPEEDGVLAWTRPGAWEWTRSPEPDEELGGGAILVWKDFPAEGSGP